jgi:hypothetical protein
MTNLLDARPIDRPPDPERNAGVSKSKKHQHDKQETADAWVRWQLLASIARIVIEIVQPLLDRYGGGRLL